MSRWCNMVLSSALAGALVFFAAGAARAEEWGTIKGQVVWDGGKVPKPEKLDITKDQGHCLSKGPIYKEEFVINPKNKGVRWAVVYLISSSGNFFDKNDVPIHPSLKKIKSKTIEIDQPCCKFEPHVLAMREGQTLVVKNSAPVAHNANIIGGAKGPSLNPTMPPDSKITVEDIKARPTAITISCGMHGWMKGWLFVLRNPYFAVTDENGNFEIKNVPAGNYRLVVWQEGMGWVAGDKEPNKKGKKITIKADGVTDLGQFKVKPS